MSADQPKEHQPEKLVFKKKYSDEELCDLGRDIHEAFDERFNPAVAGIPCDEHNFRTGQFTVTVTWSPDE